MLKQRHFKSILTSRQWKVRAHQSEWKGATSVPEAQQNILMGRGLSSLDDLDYSLGKIPHFRTIKNINKATQFLREIINDDKRILVVGDYDVDGATSTATAVTGLRMLGAKNVDYLIPNRLRTGYGLSPALIPEILQRSPDCVITVDNGISAIPAAQMLEEHGISLLVTDHHLPGEDLPASVAIINPNQIGDDFPCKNLAGVGVVFYLLCALRALMKKTDVDLKILVPWVALGTVADCVPLDHTNRTLVYQGLRMIQRSSRDDGIRALCMCAGIDATRITAEDIGFGLAPRLNAAGRLDDMSWGVACLLSSGSVALSHAQKLNDLNQERKSIQQMATEQTIRKLTDLYDEKSPPSVIVECDATWHEGIIGLIATRLKDQYMRPTFVLTQGEDGCLKGSGRSINAVHLHRLLQAVDRKHPGLLLQFGGHAMACGVKIDKKSLKLFASAVQELADEIYCADEYIEECECDGLVSAESLTIDLARFIRNATPWGQEFDEPIFCGRFMINDRRFMGEGRHMRLTLCLVGNQSLFNAVVFHCQQHAWESIDWDAPVWLVYRCKVNYYKGRESLQLQIIDAITDT